MSNSKSTAADPRRSDRVHRISLTMVSESVLKTRRILDWVFTNGALLAILLSYDMGIVFPICYSQWRLIIKGCKKINKIFDPKYRLSGLIFEDFTSDYMSVIGMLFSMFGLMMRMKWCAWIAIYCSCIGFASSRLQDDAKQIFSSFMLSISAVVMSYLQNPSPMTMPFSN